MLAVGSIAVPAAPQSTQRKQRMPEIYNGKARVKAETATGATGDVYVNIQVDQYTPDGDIKTMQEALQSGGSDAFTQALKKAPVAGHLNIGDKKFPIRWARKQTAPRGYVISLVVDTPVYFVGAGLPGAKARAGFNLAVLQLRMDSANIGEGSIAPAAKVKPGGATGVDVEDYGSEPVKIVSLMRVIS